jgi:hypothetical protein
MPILGILLKSKLLVRYSKTYIYLDITRLITLFKKYFNIIINLLLFSFILS